MKNSNISSKTPYIRFITKNLEINFDWLRLICETFKDELQFTSQAQEKIKQKQEGHQWYTERTKEFITGPKDRLTRAQNNNMPIFDIDLKCYEDKVPYLNFKYNQNDFINFMKKLNIPKEDKKYDIRIFIIYNLTNNIVEP
ncbi:hypothetical protein ACMBCQ_02450 [Candidatus Phytoplasma citri]